MNNLHLLIRQRTNKNVIYVHNRMNKISLFIRCRTNSQLFVRDRTNKLLLLAHDRTNRGYACSNFVRKMINQGDAGDAFQKKSTVNDYRIFVQFQYKRLGTEVRLGL